MDLGISGLNALVVGGSQGLGYACAQALVQEGVNVAINGRDAEKAARAAQQLGTKVLALPGDISNNAERARIVEQFQQHLGRVDILVTNAGGPPPGPFEEHGHDTWLKALETNMLAAIDMAGRVLPGMKEAGFGRIVNVTSFTVREPYPNMSLATLAREVAPFGVTVNNILPGLMDTPALVRVYRAQSEREGISIEQARQRMADSIPMKRLGLEEDFGPVCAFLCSRHSGYMTGQNFTVDGGLVRSLL
jgi:3-oxoacyl-[acyl-carrier protein] reductase